MRLLSVNVGPATPIEGAGKSGQTGIFKRPTPGPVAVGRLGLAGDAIVDTPNHGGPDQAVHLYGAPDYTWWSRELGEGLTPGTFGENLTVAGMRSAEYCIGDGFSVGKTVLEVTAPRIPCSTLNARMGDRMFAKRFRQAERPGLYCRVLREGEVRAGDAVEVERYAGEKVFAVEMFRDFFGGDATEAALRRYLSVPIAVRARKDTEKRLRRLLAREASSVPGAAVSKRKGFLWPRSSR